MKIKRRQSLKEFVHKENLRRLGAIRRANRDNRPYPFSLCRCVNCRERYVGGLNVTGGRCDRCKWVATYLRIDAARAVNFAIKSGYLSRPESHSCSDCEREASAWEHRDYRRPLDVVPICPGCNARRGPGLIGTEPRMDTADKGMSQ